MNVLEAELYKTRKSVLEVCRHLDIQYPPDVEISAIEECSSCGIWLKPSAMVKDLDNNLICKDCEYHYGL